MRSKQNNHNRDIDDLRRQNGHLEAQIRALERAKNSGQYHSSSEILQSQGLDYEPSGEGEVAGGESNGAGGASATAPGVGESGSGSDSNSDGGECQAFFLSNSWCRSHHLLLKT